MKERLWPQATNRRCTNFDADRQSQDARCRKISRGSGQVVDLSWMRNSSARIFDHSDAGAAAGASGMTAEHLRPLLNVPRILHLLFRAADSLAAALVPQSVVDILKVGRITALQKARGGVLGIVAGDIVRRLVARTMAEIGPGSGEATAPFQYAMRTRAGCKCVAPALQALCEVDPELTVLSIDGISACDSISRVAMLQGLRGVNGQAVPFVRMFYGQPSTYIWEDEHNVVHSIHLGEGGEQGDALMPLLFSLGQHGAFAQCFDVVGPSREVIRASG